MQYAPVDWMGYVPNCVRPLLCKLRGEYCAVRAIASMDKRDRLDGDRFGRGVGCRTVQLLRSCLNGAQFRHFEEPGLIARKYSEVLWAGMLTGGVGSLQAVTPLS